MKIAANILELIGHTPLVRLSRTFERLDNIVAAKLENFNPAGSVKDRAALGMILDAEEHGKLGPGAVIIEATSGNTGISLALIAASRGYKAIIIMPDSMTVERRKILSAFGAEVRLTPAHLGMQGAIDAARELNTKTPGSFLVGQFDNPANPRIHESTTAEEIIADTDGKVDVVVAGVGTGGTISGVGKRLKRHNQSIRIIAVEPAGSPVISNGMPGPHMIQGIGAGFVPSILDRSIIDEIITVGDAEAFNWTKKIIREEGLFVGISSGAAAAATSKYLNAKKFSGKTIVTIFPDSGQRYLSISQLFS